VGGWVQDEWQRLKAWLPPLPTAPPDEAADVTESGRFDYDFGPRTLADISENSPLRIGMGRPHPSIAVSQEIQVRCVHVCVCGGCASVFVQVAVIRRVVSQCVGGCQREM
jgi:hypothetical protein